MAVAVMDRCSTADLNYTHDHLNSLNSFECERPYNIPDERRMPSAVPPEKNNEKNNYLVL